jgi:glucosyl-3-phosphoglycerate synthase
VLIDTAQRHGIDAIAQVDLGKRAHGSQPDLDLAVMAAELLLVAERRRTHGSGASAGGIPGALAVPELCQFARQDGVLQPRTRLVPSAERPAISSLRLGVAG